MNSERIKEIQQSMTAYPESVSVMLALKQVWNECEQEQSKENPLVAYQTFLKESINELLKAESSIVKDGYIKISIDEDYKCSDDDLARYKIEYKYPLHLIHLGQDLHKAELNLSKSLKEKWFIS